jgi:DNA-binding transcriptional LysR family regulator
MDATLRQLRILLTLADVGSVTRTAQRLHVTQPTISMQLKQLTAAVGEPLHEHVGRQVRLTEAGQALATTARDVFDRWAAFEQELDARRGLKKGRLRLAVVSTAKYFVPRVLGQFCTRHPDIEIALELLNRDAVVARLRENRDDLYVMSIPPEDLPLEREAFLPNPLLMVAPAGHPLAKRQTVRLEQLAQERFILREPGSGTRMACDRHFAERGFVPQVRLELGSNEAIREAVAAGMGLSVLSRYAVGPKTSAAKVAILRVQGFPIPSRWNIIWVSGKRLSPVALAFLEHLRRFAERQRVDA